MMSGVCRKGMAMKVLQAKAQDVHSRLWEHHQEHPKATWQQRYDDVPNHYANAISMRCAMKWLQAKGKVRHTLNLARSGFNAYGGKEEE